MSTKPLRTDAGINGISAQAGNRGKGRSPGMSAPPESDPNRRLTPAHHMAKAFGATRYGTMMPDQPDGSKGKMANKLTGKPGTASPPASKRGH